MMMLVLMLGTTFVFSSCDKDDDEIDEPTVEQISPDLILGYWSEDTDEYYDSYSISKDKIIYKHDALLQAEGTYSFDGTNLIADYTRIIMDVDSYDGFVRGEDFYYGKPCKKTYTILSCDGKNMTIKKQDGRQIKLTKYADLK